MPVWGRALEHDTDHTCLPGCELPTASSRNRTWGDWSSSAFQGSLSWDVSQLSSADLPSPIAPSLAIKCQFLEDVEIYCSPWPSRSTQFCQVLSKRNPGLYQVTGSPEKSWFIRGHTDLGSPNQLTSGIWSWHQRRWVSAKGGTTEEHGGFLAITQRKEIRRSRERQRQREGTVGGSNVWGPEFLPVLSFGDVHILKIRPPHICKLDRIVMLFAS